MNNDQDETQKIQPGVIGIGMGIGTLIDWLRVLRLLLTLRLNLAKPTTRLC